eukprot:scaffold129114_cov43-Prasinocladus_malaysianus.AAC.1
MSGKAGEGAEGAAEVRSKMAGLSMQDRSHDKDGDANPSHADHTPQTEEQNKESQTEPPPAWVPESNAASTAKSRPYSGSFSKPAQPNNDFAAERSSTAAKIHAQSINNMQSAEFPPSQSFWFPSPSPMKKSSGKSSSEHIAVLNPCHRCKCHGVLPAIHLGGSGAIRHPGAAGSVRG